MIKCEKAPDHQFQYQCCASKKYLKASRNTNIVHLPIKQQYCGLINALGVNKSRLDKRIGRSNYMFVLDISSYLFPQSRVLCLITRD